ncbi:MAG: porin [Phycisphaerales bacterium]
MNLTTNTSMIGALVLTAGTTFAGEPTSLSMDVENALHAEVTADASNHASFATNTNEYAPRVFGFIQTRYNANFSDGYTFSSEDTTTGFELSRTRIGVRGGIHPRVSYKIEGDFRSSTGAFRLLDAYTDIELNDSWDLRIGQFAAPYTRERQVSSRRQLASERSTTHRYFDGSRTQGVGLRYSSDKVRGFLTFNEGFGNTNTAFNAAAEADYAITGRLEYLGAGAWDAFRDFTSWRGSSNAWLVGGGVHWQDGGETGATGGTTADMEIFAATADLSMEFDGSNLFAGFYFQSMDSAAGDFDDMGAAIQAGMFVTDIVEVFGRWDAVFADSSRPANDDFHTLTAGVNYYLIENSHAAKLTFEIAYNLDEQASSPVPANTTAGVLGSTDEQFNLRAQLSVLF